jgi:hypothetical protein
VVPSTLKETDLFLEVSPAEVLKLREEIAEGRLADATETPLKILKLV